VFLKLWNKEIRILKYREEFQVSREIPQELILIFRYKLRFDTVILKNILNKNILFFLTS